MPFGALLGPLIGAGGSILGAGIGAGAASSAAKEQAQAAQAATQLQRDIFGQTTQNLAPFLGAGQNALAALQTGTGLGGGQFNPNAPLLQPATSALGGPPQFPTLPQFSPQGFQQSPGYQWQLGQGIDAIQNSAAGKTGSISGNTLKALQTYGTGLANQDYYNWLNQVYTPTFNSQFQNTLLPYQANNANYWNLINQFNQAQQNQYGRLTGLAGAGQSAAAMQGGFGQNFGGQAGQNIIGAGNAAGAARLVGANAITGGIGGAINNLFGPNIGSGSGIGNALASLFAQQNTGGYPGYGSQNPYADPQYYNAQGDYSSAGF